MCSDVDGMPAAARLYDPPVRLFFLECVEETCWLDDGWHPVCFHFQFNMLFKKNTDCGFVPRISPQTPAVTLNTVDSIKHCFYRRRSLCGLWSLMLLLLLPAAGGACDVHLQAFVALSRQPIRALAAKQQPGSVFYANFARNPFNNSWLEDKKELKVPPQSPKPELM